MSQTVCQETGLWATNGRCPEHLGDACLIVLPDHIKQLRAQVVTGIYDGAPVNITLIKSDDLSALRARVAELEEREASVCPEDVGIVEYVSILNLRAYELAMLIRGLVHEVQKTNPDSHRAEKAMDYLRRHKLQGSIIR